MSTFPRALFGSPVRRAASVAVVAACLAYGLAAPAVATETFVDQSINRVTIERMRAGAGYYPAMDAALRRFTGPASSVRSFREPVVFLVWRVLPSQAWVWWAFIILVAATSALLLAATDAPAAVPLVALYLLRSARPYHHGWFDQYLIVELWVVLPVAGLLYARVRGSPRAMAAMAAIATLVRELAAGLLVGGVIRALVGRRAWRPWLAALGTVAVVGVVHVGLTLPHLVSHGTEAPLFGTGGWDRLVSMATVGLRVPHWAAAVLWALAVVRVCADRDLFLLVAPYLAIPLLGLFVGRDYWGFMVVPFVILWAGELVTLAARRLTGARTRSLAT